MRIKQKLLTGFLLITILTLGISYGTGMYIQTETVNAINIVGEKILPGNIALARMTTELYHTRVLIGDYIEDPTPQALKQIEKSLSSLDAHRTMHLLYHNDESLSAEIEKLTLDFNRAVTEHLLLRQKGGSKQQLQTTEEKIDKILQHFVESINPHIEHEFAASFQKINLIKQKTYHTRKILLFIILAVLAFAILLSFFISHLLSKPLLSLRNAAKEIGSGKLDLVVPITSHDEISELAAAFNDMAANLSLTHSDLLSTKNYISNIVNSMVDALIVLSPSGEIQTVNGATCLLLDYKEEELLGQPMQTFFNSTMLPAEDLEELAERDAIRNLNVEFKTRRGENIPMSISGAAMHDQKGNPQAVIIVARDIREHTRLVNDLNISNRKLMVEITERGQAEKALAAEKERLTVTLRSIGDGVITCDTQGKVILVNKVAETLTGWPQKEATGKPFTEIFRIINEKTRQPLESPVEMVLATGQVATIANHTILISRDGTEKVIDDSAAPIRDLRSQIIGAVLVFRDITDEERVEKELLKIKKLESISVLAGGIAHDFNNILGAILGNIELALNFIDTQHKSHKILTNAEKATLRAKDLTQQLLTFSKGGEPVKKLASLTEIITESSQFVLRGSNVNCNYHFADDLWLAEVDTGQISQVIQNIVINADQAMPKGGSIEIKCENAPLNEVLRLSPELTTPCLKITISDQGIGIPAENIEKIFDPFFSTKSTGSGLGMATSHSIINKHHGQISVESVQGKGTTFTILLPAAQNITQTDEILPAINNFQPERKHLRVLLMDDEEMLLEITTQLLSRIGHETVIAKNGETAIKLYKKAIAENKPFDITIMDLTIPGGMGGKDAAKKILEIDTKAILLASSGYSNDPAMTNPEDFGFAGSITKPYQLRDLAEAIRKAMPRNSN